MRFLTNSMLALVVAVAITGCSGGSSNSSDNSAATSGAADNSAASSDNSGAMSDNSGASSAASAAPAAAGEPPSYPGATTEAAGSGNGAMGGMSSGKVLTTTDAFEKVYAWYQKNMPAGSEKAHTTAPMKSAEFLIGAGTADQEAVTITVVGGKTMIAIAHTKK